MSSAACFRTLDMFGIPHDISLDVLLLLHIFFDALPASTKSSSKTSTFLTSLTSSTPSVFWKLIFRVDEHHSAHFLELDLDSLAQSQKVSISCQAFTLAKTLT